MDDHECCASVYEEIPCGICESRRKREAYERAGRERVRAEVAEKRFREEGYEWV